MRATLRTLHKWAALVTCLPLAVIAISGTVLVFHDNLLRLRLGDRLPAVLEADVPRDLARVGTRVAPAHWTLAKLPEEGLPVYRLWLDTGEQALMAPGGSLLDRYRPMERPESAIFELHSTLLAGEAGEQVVGITGLVALCLLVTGLYLWWPAARSWRRADLVLRTQTRRAALRAHNAWAALALPVLLLVFSTGALLTYFDAARTLLGWLAGPASVATPVLPDMGSGIGPGPVNWEAVMATANAAYDDDEPVFVYPPGPEGGAVRFRTRRAAEWHPNGRSTLLVHPRSGALLAAQDATTVAWPTRFLNTSYPLHSARGAAAWTWPLILASGLALVLVILHGVLGWWRRARAGRQAVAPVSAG